MKKHSIAGAVCADMVPNNKPHSISFDLEILVAFCDLSSPNGVELAYPHRVP